MLEYQNDCVEEETMVVYSQFVDCPHCYLVQMSCEDDMEIVSVGFMHYGNDMVVHFDTSTRVGEVWLWEESYSQEGESGYTPYGMIEVGDLVELLGRMPHIDSFMVQCAGVH